MSHNDTRCDHSTFIARIGDNLIQNPNPFPKPFLESVHRNLGAWHLYETLFK